MENTTSYRLTENGLDVYQSTVIAFDALEEIIPNIMPILGEHGDNDFRVTSLLIKLITGVKPLEIFRDIRNQGTIHLPAFQMENISKELSEHSFTEHQVIEAGLDSKQVVELMSLGYVELVDDVLRSFQEVLEDNIINNDQDIISAILDSKIQYDSTVENIAEELEDCPNGLSPKEVKNIIWVLCNSNRIESLRTLANKMKEGGI